MNAFEGATPPLSGETAYHRLLGRPRRLALLIVVGLAGLGWVYIGHMVAASIRTNPAEKIGATASLIDLLQGGNSATLLRAVFAAVCRPALAGGAIEGAAPFVTVFAMWCAMALAMMVPTAGPMILTYAEIADTAARKRERVVPPVTLAAGYVFVWLGFAFVATVLQWIAIHAAPTDPTTMSASGFLTGALFVGAGLYQFSPLKRACLTACQRPFPFFFANWTTRPAGVFRLGLRQGLYCLGCCWALMLVMFASGVMNVVWMAVLGVVMAIEKLTTTARFSRLVGGILLAVGAACILSAAGPWAFSQG
jgi:predicted metal-binding membrane protein